MHQYEVISISSGPSNNNNNNINIDSSTINLADQSAISTIVTEYVKVALNDQQVLRQLQDIEAGNKSVKQNASVILDACELFIQDLLVRFFARGDHPKLVDCINTVLGRAEELSRDKIFGLVAASFTLGGSCW